MCKNNNTSSELPYTDEINILLEKSELKIRLYVNELIKENVGLTKSNAKLQIKILSLNNLNDALKEELNAIKKPIEKVMTPEERDAEFKRLKDNGILDSILKRIGYYAEKLKY